MGRRGYGLERGDRAQATKAYTGEGGEDLGRGMGQRRREGRLAEAHAPAGIRVLASPMGGGAHLLVVRAEQKDEPGLREALCASAEAFVYAAMIRL